MCIPKVVIICSQKFKDDASLLCKYLEKKDDEERCQVDFWPNRIPASFGNAIMDDVEQSILKADFSVCMLTPDDLVNNHLKQPRANVWLELGLSRGILGKEKPVQGL